MRPLPVVQLSRLQNFLRHGISDGDRRDAEFTLLVLFLCDGLVVNNWTIRWLTRKLPTEHLSIAFWETCGWLQLGSSHHAENVWWCLGSASSALSLSASESCTCPSSIGPGPGPSRDILTTSAIHLWRSETRRRLSSNSHFCTVNDLSIHFLARLENFRGFIGVWIVCPGLFLILIYLYSTVLDKGDIH